MVTDVPNLERIRGFARTAVELFSHPPPTHRTNRGGHAIPHMASLLGGLEVSCSPLCSRAGSHMYKQMESRRLVPMNENVLFPQNHTEIGLMVMRLHPISQMTKHVGPLFQAPTCHTALSRGRGSVLGSCPARASTMTSQSNSHLELKAVGRVGETQQRPPRRGHHVQL